MRQILVNQNPDHMLSDKKAFEAVNPGCTIGDFVRWCSFKEWMQEMVTDEGGDTSNEGHLNQRIKISDNVWLVFQKSAQRQKGVPDDDDAKEVLHWLASVKPSDLVFRLMPILIHSVATTLLKHSECQLTFLKYHLDQVKIKLEKASSHWSNGAPHCASSGELKKVEDLIHHLTFIEQKMATAHYLLKKFRHVDPSCMVDDLTLQKFVSNLMEFKEVPIQTSNGELPSQTDLGRLFQKFFFNDHKEMHPDSKAAQVVESPVANCTKKVYIFTLDYSGPATSRSCPQRFHCTNSMDGYRMACAFTSDLFLDNNVP